VKKANYGRTGEKIRLRWNGLTFTTDTAATASPYQAAAEAEVDEIFLRLLDKRNTYSTTPRTSQQGLWLRASGIRRRS
jgi:hypothetical protein